MIWRVGYSCVKEVKHHNNKSSTKDNKYTVLELTNLEDKPMMCIIIFMDIKHPTIVERGLDIQAVVFGDLSSRHFFKENIMSIKRFHNGQTCEYIRHSIPCL